MSIPYDAVLGQDVATLTFETSTVTLQVVNWDSTGWGFEYEQTDFNVAQSTVSGFVTPRKRTPTLTLSGKRGLSETFLDWQQIFDSEKLTNVTMTDLPSHADMVAEYGDPKVVSVRATQPESFGTYEITVRWGARTHGYQ